MSRILLVEDDEHLAEGMCFNLRNAGYDVVHVDRGEDALARLERGPFDLVLLDVMLPGIDGYEVVRAMRAAGNMNPVIILTAKDRAEDAIEGLDAGADDYVTKPFDLDEILARVRGALRRQVWMGGESEAERPGSARIGEWTVDFARFVATHEDGREKALTATETAVLAYFAQHPGEVITRKTFLKEVWGRTGELETRTVDNFVRKLRSALEKDPSRPEHILSVRGAGYKFTP
jgi:two-component system alkaline phosphatase synthesis response regulator PhoP